MKGETLDPKAHPKWFVAIEDVFFKPAPLNLSVGDLYWTDEGLYFVCHHHIVGAGAGQFGSLFGSAVGGLAGAIATGIASSGSSDFASSLTSPVLINS